MVATRTIGAARVDSILFTAPGYFITGDPITLQHGITVDYSTGFLTGTTSQGHAPGDRPVLERVGQLLLIHRWYPSCWAFKNRAAGLLRLPGAADGQHQQRG